MEQLLSLVPAASRELLSKSILNPSVELGLSATAHTAHGGTGRFGVAPFFIRRGTAPTHALPYAMHAPTTRRNLVRVLRALQLPKAILLEGSPGVGKTSLLTALAASSGHTLVRINLSEQTDMMDLLGLDLPVRGGKGGEFAWCDGVFLQALKAGHWVLLDELNLASQSVLEGLNAVLDHRAQVYIPELDRTFDCPPQFRVSSSPPSPSVVV
jgi:midasin